ncbi:hypothetical protein TomTYG75_20880 [Sphingobium sp. TomTYG75]
MKSHPEHQQNDTDFGQFVGQTGVGDKAWGERTNHDPRDKVTDKRRKFETMGNGTHYESNNEARDDCSDQGRVMRHGRPSLSAGAAL